RDGQRDEEKSVFVFHVVCECSCTFLLPRLLAGSIRLRGFRPAGRFKSRERQPIAWPHTVGRLSVTSSMTRPPRTSPIRPAPTIGDFTSPPMGPIENRVVGLA